MVSCTVGDRRVSRRRASRRRRGRTRPHRAPSETPAPRDERSPGSISSLRRRQRHPASAAVNGAAVAAQFGAGALGMDDAAPGRHPVDFARADRSDGAETVAVHDLAVEQIGDGREPDMRMRPHVEPGAGAEVRRPEIVEEDEGPDHARARRRQRAPHREASPRSTCAARSPARWPRRHRHRRPCGSLPGKKLMRLLWAVLLRCAVRRSVTNCLLLHRLHQAVECFVHFVPVRQLLQAVEPALDVRIGREIDADDLAQRDEAGAEIIGDGDLVAA